MTTSSMAEREAELAALQAAFDEYITSSRELEEELDAELAKMQEKLAESSAANAALSAQLENMSPQLASLERALAESRQKLEHEQRLRREAEQLQDEAEARCREMEGELVALREDCDAAHEELAFKESELEETRLELEVERERHRVEIEDLQLDLQQQQSNAQEPPSTNGEDEAVQATKKETFIDEEGFLAEDDKGDDDYVKRLEDELELVTEQLIEAEQKLSRAEDDLNTLKAAAVNGAKVETVSKQQEEEMIQLKESHHAKVEELQTLREELELAKEELTLTQEELRAAEEDVKNYEAKMDDLRSHHRDEVSKLKSDLEKAEMEARSAAMGLQNIEGTLTRSAQDSEGLKNEVDNLSKALENAKADHAAALEELEELYQKFDEAKEQAERAGRDAATQEIRAVVAAERKNEVSKLKKEIEELMQTNSNIRKRLDEAEMSVAAAHDSGKQVDDEKSETVRRLQDQLDRTKDELGKKDEDIKELKDVMETRMTKAEKDVARLEKELSVTKGKLYEAEATLIVSKRDKARSGQMITQAIPQRSRSKDGPRVIDNAEELGSQSDALSRRLQDSGRRSRSKSPTTPQRWQFRIEEEKRNADELRKQLDELKEQNRMSESHQRRLEEDLRTLQKQLFAGEGDAPVATQMSRISQLAAQRSGDFFGEDGASSVEDIIETNDPAKMAEELRSLHKKNADQRDYNAQLLSKILSLQGNIQVCCRVRPLRMKEIQAGNTTSVEALGEAEVGCHDERNSKWKSFAFDKVWGPDQTQQSIFQDVEPLALSVVDGYNACIFAYGQTGSGKTYTMEGVEENNNYGISYRTIQKIFTLLNFRYQQQRAATAVGTASKEFSFKLQLGMLEIYNDEIFDLLADHAQAGSKADQKREAKKAGVKATLDIRRSEDGHIEVPGLTKEPVGSIKEVMALLKRGNANRATASTNLNEHSSRSHMVLSVEVESGLEGEPANKGTLYLVDLAGSERVRKSKVEGEQLKEATFINKSLSALGNVMEALDRKASHVPYRDSKLTYLLQDALGGNSRTMMVVTVCPMDTAYDESVHALQFATRVRRIQIGAAQRNVTSKNLEETVKSLTAEMKALSMAKEKSENQLSSLKRDNTRIQERLQTISSQRSKTQSDHKTLEVLRKNNSEMAARWNKEKALRERQSEELQKLKDELQKIQNELNKLAREKEGLQRQLEEKENQLSKAAEDVRVAKDASSAANLRARKAQIIGSRHTASRPSLSTPSRTPPRTPPTTTSKSAKDTNVDIEEVRQEVLALLEKYDQAKVDRIDIIMDKFKGKESLLVEKMKQRYEGGGVTTPSGASQSLQRRSELALQRHKERMQKRLEQQNTG